MRKRKLEQACSLFRVYKGKKNRFKLMWIGPNSILLTRNWVKELTYKPGSKNLLISNVISS